MNDQQVVLGWLSAEAIASASPSSVEDAMQPGPSTFRPNVPLEEMRDYMLNHKMERAVVTSSDGRLIGAVDLSEIEHALHESGHGPRQKRYV